MGDSESRPFCRSSTHVYPQLNIHVEYCESQAELHVDWAPTQLAESYSNQASQAVVRFKCSTSHPFKQ